MQKIKKIHKHFPLKVISTLLNNHDQYYIKSQGQNWIQLHNHNQLKDVISLPHSLRMFQFENCIQVFQNNGYLAQFLFTNNNSVCIGSPNEIGTETSTLTIQLPNCEQMTNTVYIGTSKYCNISQNNANNTQINIFSNSSAGFIHQKYDIDFIVVKNSKITYNQYCMYFASCNYSERMISYNLNMQMAQLLFCLPEIAKEDFVKQPFFLPSSSNHCRINQDIMFIYAKNWLAIGDIRMKRLVAFSELMHCQSAFSISSQGIPHIYFTQQNLLKEYDFRKISSRREPILTHQQTIINCYPITNQIIGVESNSFSGISLYSPIVCLRQ